MLLQFLFAAEAAHARPEHKPTDCCECHAKFTELQAIQGCAIEGLCALERTVQKQTEELKCKLAEAIALTKKLECECCEKKCEKKCKKHHRKERCEKKECRSRSCSSSSSSSSSDTDSTCSDKSHKSCESHKSDKHCGSDKDKH